MAAPLDALFAKADAFDGMKTAAWAEWARWFVDSLNGRANFGTAVQENPLDETGTGMTARLVRDLDYAETFYVSPEMNRLVTAAAEAWESEEDIWMEDFPAPVGWMWIPGGLSRIDIRGQIVTTSAVSWHVTGGQVELTFWTDKVHDRPDNKAKPGWDLMPRLTPWHTVKQPLGRPIFKAIQMGTVLPPEVSEQIRWIDTGPDGAMTATFPEGWTADQLKLEARTDGIVAWLISALRIMVTPLAETRRQGLPTGVRKSLQRRPHRFRVKAVTVIEFRRRDVSASQSSNRDFSHRWLRRGHWRKQWRGSERDGTRQQVRIWIHPQICGPEDKPFILRQHVNAFTR